MLVPTRTLKYLGIWLENTAGYKRHILETNKQVCEAARRLNGLMRLRTRQQASIYPGQRGHIHNRIRSSDRVHRYPFGSTETAAFPAP